MYKLCYEFQTELVPKLTDNTENAVDTDTRMLDAYINQCTAEAQEGMGFYCDYQKNKGFIAGVYLGYYC